MPSARLPHKLETCGITGIQRSLPFADDKSVAPRWHAVDDANAWSHYPYVRLQPPHSFNLIFADLDIDFEASYDAILDLTYAGLPPSFTTTQRADSGQASWCLSTPIHLSSPNRSKPVLFAPIIYYKHITKQLRSYVHGSKHGHGRSRQRNPLFEGNNGHFIEHAGYSLTEIASAIGVDYIKPREELESAIIFTKEAAGSKSTKFGPRSTASYDDRLSAATTEAQYTYANRHEFIALRVMRGHYHLAHDIGPHFQALTATVESINTNLPVPFIPNESGGVECIVQGIIDSFASGKIYGMTTNRKAQAAHIAGGRASARKAKAKVKDRNALIFEQHLKGSTADDINIALKNAGFKTLSGGRISTIIKQNKPLTTTRAQRDNSIIAQWMTCKSLSEIARRHQVCRQTVTRVIIRHIDKTARNGMLLYVPRNIKMTSSIIRKIKTSKVAFMQT